MSARFIRAPHQRKSHVISEGLVSAVSTLYTTACGQIVRYRSDGDVRYYEPGTVAVEDLCGICRRKTTQALA